MSALDSTARQAVLTHMNSDHGSDSLVIVRANGAPAAVSAEMLDIDDTAGTWSTAQADGTVTLVKVWWPQPLTSRQSAREQIVAVYDAAMRAR
jgi:hypothetical protein